jgi:hypothetical protein
MTGLIFKHYYFFDAKIYSCKENMGAGKAVSVPVLAIMRGVLLYLD